MVRLYSEILFLKAPTFTEQFVLNQVTEVETFESWDNMTATAKITFPFNLKFKKNDITTTANAMFNRGDFVQIKLGYYPDLKVVFSGYITKVSPTKPIVIECDDDMFVLKQLQVKPQSYNQIKLPDLIKNIVSQKVDFKALDITLGSVRIDSQTTVAMVLDFLQKEYNLTSYFKNRILYVGFQTYPDVSKTQKFRFQWNIIDDSQLQYQRADDTKVKLKAVSINANNEKIEYETGDVDGEVRTKYYYGLNQTDLKTFADRDISEFKYDGYTGSFEAFGEPFIQQGDYAELSTRNGVLTERNGTYAVKSVRRTFGINGYRQEIEPETKVQ